MNHGTGQLQAASVLVVIVHYRRSDATLRCMEAVQRQTLPAASPDGGGRAGGLWAGVVVNNGYPDAANPALGAEDRQHVEQRARSLGWGVIDAGRNSGFAAGSNLGIARALAEGFEFIWLINPDAIADEGALAALVQAARSDPRIGAVGSDLGGGPPGGRVSLWRGQALETSDEPWEFISGASVLLRAEAIREVGPFDESLFLYWEDVELSIRLGDKGWKLAVERGSRVRHEGGGAVGKASIVQDYYSARNALLVVRKQLPWVLPVAAVMVLWRITAMKLLRGEGRRLAAAWRGWFDGLRGRGGRWMGS